MSYCVGIDIGGMFIDFVLFKGDEVIFYKNFSILEDCLIGVMIGLEKLV